MTDPIIANRGTAKNPFRQADIDAIVPDSNGIRHMPSGHYAAWCSFGEGCSFGEWCSFGERCSFGEGCSFEDGYIPDDWQRPYFAVDRIGSASRKAYFFCFGRVMHVRAGCFFGDETAFRAKLDGGEDPRKTRQYLAALELARDILGAHP